MPMRYDCICTNDFVMADVSTILVPGTTFRVKVTSNTPGADLRTGLPFFGTFFFA